MVVLRLVLDVGARERRTQPCPDNYRPMPLHNFTLGRSSVCGNTLLGFALCVLALGLAPAPAQAQAQGAPAEAPAAPPPGESDPTQIVFLSTRSEFTRLAGDNWTQVLIVRSDRAALRRKPFHVGKIGVLGRFDLPLVFVDRGSGVRGGLGDLYLQGLVAPILSRRFAVGIGTGLTIPTATDRTLGTGQWRLAPMALPIWFLGTRGFVLLKVQHHWSFAGDDGRPDVDYLLVTPTVLYRPARRWWILTDTELKKNWSPRTTTAFSSSLEVGFNATRRMGLAVRPEVGWGADRERAWAVKVIATWYRP